MNIRFTLRKFLATLSLNVLLLLPLGAIATAQTPICEGGSANCNVLNPACQGNSGVLCQTNAETNKQEPGNNKIYGPNGILTRAFRIISIIVGISSIFVIIIGGLRYVLASGDPTNVNNAKNAIVYALIGLAAASSAQLLVIFVLSRL